MSLKTASRCSKRQSENFDWFTSSEEEHCSPVALTFTGALLDILQRTGVKGYTAFLESLELDYPQLYSRITGKEPNKTFSILIGLFACLSARLSACSSICLLTCLSVHLSAQTQQGNLV